MCPDTKCAFMRLQEFGRTTAQCVSRHRMAIASFPSELSHTRMTSPHPIQDGETILITGSPLCLPLVDGATPNASADLIPHQAPRVASDGDS